MMRKRRVSSVRDKTAARAERLARHAERQDRRSIGRQEQRGPRVRRDHGATRDRLLDAGRVLFARDGFHKTTVREIAAEAGANLAAVSYHFRDKLGLYQEIVKGVIEATRDFSDATMRPPTGLTTEARIEHYIRTSLERMSQPDPGMLWIHQLMRHEMMNPSPAFLIIIEQGIAPRLRYLGTLVAEILGCPASDADVGFCVASIQAQCLFHLKDPMRRVAYAGWDIVDVDLDRLTRHIVAFSLAGIRAIGSTRARGTPAAQPRKSTSRAGGP
jgi:AcrR family transcriptional regulator